MSPPDIVCDNLVLSQHDMAHLKDSGIACTQDDFKYDHTSDGGTYGKIGQERISQTQKLLFKLIILLNCFLLWWKLSMPL